MKNRQALYVLWFFPWVQAVLDRDDQISRETVAQVWRAGTLHYNVHTTFLSWDVEMSSTESSFQTSLNSFHQKVRLLLSNAHKRVPTQYIHPFSAACLVVILYAFLKSK